MDAEELEGERVARIGDAVLAEAEPQIERIVDLVREAIATGGNNGALIAQEPFNPTGCDLMYEAIAWPFVEKWQEETGTNVGGEEEQRLVEMTVWLLKKMDSHVQPEMDTQYLHDVLCEDPNCEFFRGGNCCYR